MYNVSYFEYYFLFFSLDWKFVSGNANLNHLGINESFAGKSFTEIFQTIDPSWIHKLPKENELKETNLSVFLPWSNSKLQEIGVDFQIFKIQTGYFVVLNPTIAPQNTLKLLSGDSVFSVFESGNTHKEENETKADFEKNKEVLSPEKNQKLNCKGKICKDSIIQKLFMKLQLAESKLETYFKNFPGIFFSQRTDLSFKYFSPQLENLLGSCVSDFHRNSNSFLSLIPEEDRIQFLETLETSVKNKGPFSCSYRIKNSNDSKFYYILDIRIPTFSPTGLLIGYDGILVDRTRQAITEMQLSQAAWKENISLLTAGLIHDFSNVMAGIFSLSELYCSKLKPEDPIYEGVFQIKKNSLQAQKLVRRLIDLNREKRKEKNYHNLEFLIQDQIDLLKVILPKKTDVQTKFTGRELPVFLDDVSFRQMILNLAMNSKDAMADVLDQKITIEIKYLEKDSIVFSEIPEESFKTETKAAEIIFKDNGTGISEEHQKKVFEPFFTTKEVSKGSGFGLYNIKMFLDDISGKITLKSKLGEGTTFFIYLPLVNFFSTENDFEDTNNSQKFAEIILTDDFENQSEKEKNNEIKKQDQNDVHIKSAQALKSSQEINEKLNSVLFSNEKISTEFVFSPESHEKTESDKISKQNTHSESDKTSDKISKPNKCIEIKTNAKESKISKKKKEERVSIVVYANQDPIDFKIVSLFREQEWEVITFTNVDSVSNFLQETIFLPTCVFLIDLGYDKNIPVIINTLKTNIPDMKIVLQSIGKSPDDSHDETESKVDYFIKDCMPTKTVLDIIRKFFKKTKISEKITISR